MRCFAPKQVWVILVIILCRGEAFQAGEFLHKPESWLLAARAGSARAHLGQCTRYVSFIFKVGDELTSFFLILIFLPELLKEAGDSLPEASFPILLGSQIWSLPNSACSGSISLLVRLAVFLPDGTIELGVERERAVSSASHALSKSFSSRRHARARSFTG
ncbi:hypothetical protein B0H14DRAFT_2704954 [Mycena olivaceomarginata]|nr:hypothetical protein B0H14DRAFT_2704954 [Mycena olivaceomarginata]